MVRLITLELTIFDDCIIETCMKVGFLNLYNSGDHMIWKPYREFKNNKVYRLQDCGK